jgi:Rieske Fe-S protein
VADGTDRRGALAWIVRGLGAALGALYAIPAVRYLASRRAESAARAIDVGAVDALPEGVPHRAPIRAAASDAWSTDGKATAAVFLVRHGETVRALDATCPHTGCAVDWDGTRFRCPCHQSEFTADGDRTAGPAPRGLDPQTVEIKDGRIRVTYCRYRTGRTDRVRA